MTKSDPVLRCVDDTGAKGEFYALDRGNWREIRKVQPKAEKGKPFTVPTNGIFRFPSFCKGKQVRIFIEVEDADSISENSE